MSDLDHLIAEAELGEAARSFLESELGKCLIGMARQDSLEALDQLRRIDPSKTQEIRELQNRADLGDRFEAYIKELIHRGNQALEIFIHESKD